MSNNFIVNQSSNDIVDNLYRFRSIVSLLKSSFSDCEMIYKDDNIITGSIHGVSVMINFSPINNVFTISTKYGTIGGLMGIEIPKMIIIQRLSCIIHGSFNLN